MTACNSAEPPPGNVVATSVDAHGMPRMLEARDLPAAPAPTAMQSARIHAERLAERWGVAPGTLPKLTALGEVVVPGGTVARMGQELDGLPIWGRELRMLIAPGGELSLASGTMFGTLTPREAARFAFGEAGAVDRAVVATYGTRDATHVERAQAKRVWYATADRLVAAWLVDAYTSRAASSDAYRTVLDAATGRVIAHYSLVADAAFQYTVFAETSGEKHPFDGPIADVTPHPTGMPNGFYPPYLAGPNVVTVDGLDHLGDPWLIDGATETSGNSCDAYVDINLPNGFSDGDFRADVTSAGAFNYVYDTSIGPLVNTTQQKAAITSLFYVINWLHDFWYDNGFTETAANGQLVNYGRGGVEGDPILAEAQDNANGGSRNNANMATPDDGMSPRMQVYLWSGKDEKTLSMTPSGRTPPVGSASFGIKDFDITGTLIVGTDGAGANPTDGCTALTNTVAGMIVVVDRGNCTFKTKALNIQNAGGIGMLLVNNMTSSSPPSMGDDSTIMTTINIAMLSVTMTEGATIKSEVGAGTVTATFHRKTYQELEGSLDSTLIAHEFGHYIHHRLSFCENKMCRAMSEGWGDFDALMLTTRAGDNLDGAFPFAVYTTQGFAADPAYFGIRRAPYSTNVNINPLTYRDMADEQTLPTNAPLNASNTNSEVHNAGEVWAEVLWEGYVALLEAGPAAGETFEQTRAKMGRYVVAGLLLAPPEASPMEMRNALLGAVLAAGSKPDHDLLLAAFAKRGYGSCAVAPPPESETFNEIVESSEIAGNAQLGALVLNDDCDNDGVLDSGETATLKLQIANQGQAPLTDMQIAVTSALPGVTVLTPPMSIARLDELGTQDIEVQVSLEGQHAPVAGDLALQITATGGCQPTTSIPVAVRLNIDDKPASSATDTFDTQDSVWAPWTATWSHIRESALDGAWHCDDLATATDTRLTSPLLTASKDKPLVITFEHAFSFEQGNGMYWDGGVIEYTTDDGQTWTDISALADPGYTQTITADAGNVIGNQLAYGGTNPSWPNNDTVTLDIGTQLAGQQFRIRFRVGTDAGTGDAGWTIDNVAFSGIVGTPFPSQVADDGLCGPGTNDPIVSGGGGCCDAGPLRGSSALLALGVIGLLLRRRRR